LKRKGYRQLVLITDNATFHKARATSIFLEEHRAMIKPFYLPRYAPKLNEVNGRINKRLKKDISTNHAYKRLKNLEKAVRQYLTAYNIRHKIRDLT